MHYLRPRGVDTEGFVRCTAATGSAGAPMAAVRFQRGFDVVGILTGVELDEGPGRAMTQAFNRGEDVVALAIPTETEYTPPGCGVWDWGTCGEEAAC